MIRRFFISAFLTTAVIMAQAQIKAKAISYNVDVDLTQFASDYAKEAQQKTCKFEVDAYYTGEKLYTIVRKISTPADFPMTIRQRLYDINSKDEYNIDHENKFMVLKKDQDFKLKASGNQKKILGYNCKEYNFTDYRKVAFSVWVADKLDKNICPAGNFSLKGTALEIISSNGLHYTATDQAEGQLDTNFFDVPKDYQQEITLPPPTEKKSK